MPELPEVETIKNELSPHVIGRTITGVTILWERTVHSPPAEEFRSRLAGKRITGLSRRGKYLIFSLSSQEFLIVHMKMTGSLLLMPASAELDSYTRAILFLDDETALQFRDPRKFGKMWLAKDTCEVLPEMGPEPLHDGFTPRVLAQRLHDRKAPIKALLSDQGIIAGIGNMYADEALYSARIHPLRLGGSLTHDEIQRLHRAIIDTLTTAIGSKGASIANYYRPGGEQGTAHFNFKVAHRRNETCPECGGPVERIVVRNRGTYFCPRCQAKP